MKWLVLIAALLFAGPLSVLFSGTLDLRARWWETGSGSAALAPDPDEFRDAVVQVYAARAFGWRGVFGVHTWIAIKARDADRYRVLEVNAWRLRRSGSSIATSQREPDAYWFGSQPQLLADVRGARAEKAIEHIAEAVDGYPFAAHYRVWPGPNSNTFTAYVARHTPELGVDLPPTAIGKDYLGWWRLVARAPSQSGYQVSLWGMLGVMLAAEEGLEINLLGLSFGIDADDLTLRLPGIGRLGLGDRE